MAKQKIKISAGALILAAAAYYFCDVKTLLALLIPIIVHELGHILALLMLGFSLRSFRAELKGLCIVYSGSCGAVGHAMAAAAGPMAGLIYAAAASWGVDRLQSDWLCLSAGVSLILSVFNLLPALPLDGGRVFTILLSAFIGERRGTAVADAVGFVCAAALLAAGIWLMLKGRGVALAVAATWLLLYQESASGIVKRREII